MKCEMAKERLMDYLFSELDDSNQKEMESHLKSCEECSKELEKQQQTVSLMEKWPEVEPAHRLVFANPSPGFLLRLKEFWVPSNGRFRLFVWGIRLAVVTVVVALLFLRTDVRYADGQLSLTIGGSSRPGDLSVQSNLVSAFKRAQDENLYLTSQLIQASEQRQRDLILAGLSELSGKIDQQRIADLRYFGESLSRIDRKNEYNFDRTNSLLQGLVRVTGTELPTAKP